MTCRHYIAGLVDTNSKALGAVAFVDHTHPSPLNRDEEVDSCFEEVYIPRDSTSTEKKRRTEEIEKAKAVDVSDI